MDWNLRAHGKTDLSQDICKGLKSHRSVYMYVTSEVHSAPVFGRWSVCNGSDGRIMAGKPGFISRILGVL